MITWLLPVAVAAVASPPSLPPLPEPNMAAAGRLVAALPLTQQERDRAIENALSRSANWGLYQAKVHDEEKRRDPAYQRMLAWYRTQLPRDLAPIEATARECLAKHYASSLSVEALDELARFYATPTGQQWWAWEGNRAPLVDCYVDALPLDWRAALRAAGLKPPPEPDPRMPMY